MAEHAANRRVTEKLMLARGFSWSSIRDSLELTSRQFYTDKRAIESEKNQMIVQEDPREYFKEYIAIAKQAIEDLQHASETSDSSAAQVGAIKAKEEIFRNIIVTAQNIGILPKNQPEDKAPNNVVNIININDKASLVEELAKRLTGK
jgi:hypothetical protein